MKYDIEKFDIILKDAVYEMYKKRINILKQIKPHQRKDVENLQLAKK